MQRIVIFGGSGFIGQALIKKLSTLPQLEIISFSRSSPPSEAKKSSTRSPISYCEGNFNNLESVRSIIQPGDILFDLVTSSVPFTSMKSPIEEAHEHAFAHVKFIEAACHVGVKQIIFTSSGGSIYGEKVTSPIVEKAPLRPMSPHAISKVTIEHFLDYFGKLYKTPYLIYRLSNPYGPKQQAQEGFGIIPTIFLQIQKNQPPTIFDEGKLIRDFIFIDDLMDAMILPLFQSAKYHVYNIGSNTGISLKYLWEEIKDITGTNLEPLSRPKRPIDAQSIILNTKRFRTEFRWQPKIVLHEGLTKCWLEFQKKTKDN